MLLAGADTKGTWRRACNDLISFTQSRRKNTWLNLPAALEREECLFRDLKLLKRQNYVTLKSRQSDVWCEKCDGISGKKLRQFEINGEF